MDTPHSTKRQQGAVLLISLLVLLVLTLIGLSSLDSSVMEQKMATNAQTATSTFQQAESAIRQTYYLESPSPTNALDKAMNGTATERHRGYSTPDMAIGTDLAHPTATTTDKGALTGTSRSNAIDVGRRIQFTEQVIEITGTANVGNIQSRATQGYSVGPLPSM